MKKSMLFALILALLLVAAACASAQTAEDISTQCSLKNQSGKEIRSLTDGNYQSVWVSDGSKDRLVITAAEGQAIASVYVQFSNITCPFEVQTRDENGKWQTQVTSDAQYLCEYIILPRASSEIRLKAVNGKGNLRLAQVHMFGEGDAPEWVQQWQPPLDKADLLVISAHPDDEVLFMGGTIPYYAGERKMDVQVAHLVPATPYRKLELLDAVWLCGVRSYPDIGSFPDVYATSVSSMYKSDGWSKDRVTRYMVSLLRRYQPEVVVTHDVNGEYGHGAHKVAADAARRCVALAADAAYQDKRVEEKEPWQVKKLYLHLYEQGQIRMDWRIPLEAFGGKTAFDIAEEAFACHVSQQETEYRVEDYGPYDNALFGLAFTTVGEDTQKNDFFENVTVE